MKILIDVHGGDRFDELIKGAVSGLKVEKDVELVLVGRKNEIESELKKYKYDASRLSIIEANDIISCEDVPTQAVRQKPDSSMVTAIRTLKESDEYAGVISTGSTGAFLTSSYTLLGRIKGVSRPALSPLLPNLVNGKVQVIDCGANVDCKPLFLVHFAILGKCYMKAAYGKQSPKIGLLNNGAEEGKGNELCKTVYPMLEKCDINFIGNVEARDILNSDVDVVVCDGFAGNVAIKAIEGTALTMNKMIKKEIMKGVSKLGALISKGAFKRVKKVMDYNEYGGGVLLGLNKIALKAHGSCNARAIEVSILQVKSLHKLNLIDSIKAEIEALPKFIEEEN